MMPGSARVSADGVSEALDGPGRPLDRPRVRLVAFSAKFSTNAPSPSGLGGSAKTSRMSEAAWLVRSFQ